VIDSGWYEKNVGPSSGQWYHEVGPDPQPFEEADYVGLVDSLDPDISAGSRRFAEEWAYRFLGAAVADRIEST
jgi:hypothetical protein